MIKSSSMNGSAEIAEIIGKLLSASESFTAFLMKTSCVPFFRIVLCHQFFLRMSPDVIIQG